MLIPISSMQLLLAHIISGFVCCVTASALLIVNISLRYRLYVQVTLLIVNMCAVSLLAVLLMQSIINTSASQHYCHQSSLDVQVSTVLAIAMTVVFSVLLSDNELCRSTVLTNTTTILSLILSFVTLLSNKHSNYTLTNQKVSNTHSNYTLICHRLSIHRATGVVGQMGQG